jgi:hypothetical protein
MTYEEWYTNSASDDPCAYTFGKEAWQAADRNAREECAGIVQNEMLSGEEEPDDFAYNNALRHARHAILETIK